MLPALICFFVGAFYSSLLLGLESALPLIEEKGDSSNKNNNPKTNQIFKCSIKQLETSTMPPIRLEKKGTRILTG
jgi:hypothetical protein